MSSLLEADSQKEFLDKLLAWYRKNGRHDMPWRKTKDPYAIVVSEYMLQQTTVATVRPYYDRFLKRFPTLKSIAQSNLNDVLALWSGLGYYARARNLWAAMKGVQEKFGGRFPKDQQDLEKLPGIGAYTSGAIRSLAFNKSAVVLDGNIIRVLMRILALEEDPRLKAVLTVLKKVILDLTSVRRGSGQKKTRFHEPRHVVLSLMDLGATVCLPKNPFCEKCPASATCLARKYGKVDEIPAKGDEIDRTRVRRLYAAIESRGRWLMGQRPMTGLFGGLWEFLGSDVAAGVDPVGVLEEAIQREIRVPVQVDQALTTFEHQLSHRIFTVRPFICRLLKKGTFQLPRRSFNYQRFRFVSPPHLNRLGVSAITRRIINQLSALPKN